MERSNMSYFLCLLVVGSSLALSLDYEPTLPMTRGLFGGLDKFVNQAKDKVTGTVDKVTSGAKDTINGALGTVTGSVDKVTGAVDKVTSDAKDKVTGAVDQLTAGTLDKVKETASKLGMDPTQACEEVKKIVEDFKQFKCSFSDLTFTCTTPSGKRSIKLQFVPEQMEIQYSVTIEGKEIGGRASANHPPAICLPVPNIPLLKVCIHVFDLSFARANLQANICSQVEVQIGSTTAASLNLNCVEIQAKPLKVWLQCANNAPGGGFINFDMSKVIPCNPPPAAVRALTQF